MIVATFKKQDIDSKLHHCFYCNAKPEGILTFKLTGEEVRSCEKCYLLHRKRRRNSKSKEIYQSECLETKKEPIHTREIGEKGNGVLK